MIFFFVRAAVATSTRAPIFARSVGPEPSSPMTEDARFATLDASVGPQSLLRELPSSAPRARRQLRRMELRHILMRAATKPAPAGWMALHPIKEPPTVVSIGSTSRPADAI